MTIRGQTAHFMPTRRDYAMMELANVLPRLQDEQLELLSLIAGAFEDGDHIKYLNYSARARGQNIRALVLAPPGGMA